MATGNSKSSHIINDYQTRKALERRYKPVVSDPVVMAPKGADSTNKVISSDHSLNITLNNPQDLTVWNFAESKESYYSDSTGLPIMYNYSSYDEGWIPLICSEPRINDYEPQIRHFSNKRYTFPPLEQYRDYMYFIAPREGVYRVTVSLLLKIKKELTVENRNWLLKAILILGKDDYSTVSDSNYIYNPYKKYSISTSSYSSVNGAENILDYYSAKNLVNNIPSPATTLLNSDLALSALMMTNNIVHLQGTKLVYLELDQILTSWFKIKGGIYDDDGVYLEWDNTDLITNIIEYFDTFHINWQGYNYKETGWISTHIPNYKNIVNNF